MPCGRSLFGLGGPGTRPAARQPPHPPVLHVLCLFFLQTLPREARQGHRANVDVPLACSPPPALCGKPLLSGAP